MQKKVRTCRNCGAVNGIKSDTTECPWCHGKYFEDRILPEQAVDDLKQKEPKKVVRAVYPAPRPKAVWEPRHSSIDYRQPNSPWAWPPNEEADKEEIVKFETMLAEKQQNQPQIESEYIKCARCGEWLTVDEVIKHNCMKEEK